MFYFVKVTNDQYCKDCTTFMKDLQDVAANNKSIIVSFLFRFLLRFFLSRCFFLRKNVNWWAWWTLFEFRGVSAKRFVTANVTIRNFAHCPALSVASVSLKAARLHIIFHPSGSKNSTRFCLLRYVFTVYFLLRVI